MEFITSKNPTEDSGVSPIQYARIFPNLLSIRTISRSGDWIRQRIPNRYGIKTLLTPMSWPAFLTRFCSEAVQRGVNTSLRLHARD
jgi:hypothetical protein